MDRLENGFGCKLLVEQEIDEGSDGSGESLEGSGSGDVPEGSRDKKKWENTPGNLTDETVREI